eukprot:5365626-Prymnesium_polylepis.1
MQQRAGRRHRAGRRAVLEAIRDNLDVFPALDAAEVALVINHHLRVVRVVGACSWHAHAAGSLSGALRPE